MVTLFVTCFIAGLVPFQILDKATGQLVDKIKITSDFAKEVENGRTALALYSREKAAGIFKILSRMMKDIDSDGKIDETLRGRLVNLKAFQKVSFESLHFIKLIVISPNL